MKALNDKLMLTDILAHLRDLMTAGGLAITHGSCPNLRTMVTKLNERTTAHQFEVFQYMNKHGMYPIKNVEDAEIQEVIDNHCGCGV